MRIGEVIKITHGDIENTRITLWDPKSRSEQEVVFIPKRVAGRLRTYVREQGVRSDGRIFPLTYGGARYVVKKAGERMGVKLRPHDLRRFAAIFASQEFASQIFYYMP